MDRAVGLGELVLKKLLASPITTASHSFACQEWSYDCHLFKALSYIVSILFLSYSNKLTFISDPTPPFFFLNPPLQSDKGIIAILSTFSVKIK